MTTSIDPKKPPEAWFHIDWTHFHQATEGIEAGHLRYYGVGMTEEGQCQRVQEERDRLWESLSNEEKLEEGAALKVYKKAALNVRARRDEAIFKAKGLHNTLGKRGRTRE